MAINKLILPNSVNTIKDYAFKNTSNLSKVIVGGGINTELSAILTALTNKKITLGKNIFNGISKVHPSHSFSYTVTTAATCTAAGSKSGTCTCGNTDTQTIAATGHSYGSYVVSSDGATKTRTCSRCGNKETVSNAVDLKNASTDVKSKYNFIGTTDTVGQNDIYFGSSGSGYGLYIELGSTGTSRYVPSSSSAPYLKECIVYLSKAATVCGKTFPVGYYKLRKLTTSDNGWWTMLSSGVSLNFLYIWTGTSSYGTPPDSAAVYTYLGSTYSVANAV